MGVPDSALDDATHDVFLVVHRRMHEFEGRSSVKTWLFSIAFRVAGNFRRASSRDKADELSDATPDPRALPPDEAAIRAEEARLVRRLLGRMDEEKRAVFILADLEQISAPEIADALKVPLNTVYSRLRAARQEFKAALQCCQNQDAWRLRWGT